MRRNGHDAHRQRILTRADVDRGAGSRVLDVDVLVLNRQVAGTVLADVAAEGRLADAWREFAESRTAVVALAVVVLLIGVALLAPLIVPQNPYDLTQLSIMDNKLPPLTRGLDGMLYLLGTDDQGRDMLSAILSTYAAQNSRRPAFRHARTRGRHLRAEHKQPERQKNKSGKPLFGDLFPDRA